MAGQVHKLLARTFIATAQRRYGDRIRLFERHAGLLYARDGTPIKPHRDGMGDAYGWYTRQPWAVHLEIEFKVEPDDLGPEQVAWMKTCKDHGVIWVCVVQRRLSRSELEPVEFAVGRGIDELDKAVEP